MAETLDEIDTYVHRTLSELPLNAPVYGISTLSETMVYVGVPADQRDAVMERMMEKEIIRPEGDAFILTEHGLCERIIFHGTYRPKKSS